MTPPKIDNAPGLSWRPRKYGWEARWRARPDLVKRGFRPVNVRLFVSTAKEPVPSEAGCKMIADACNALQTEMLVWGRGGVPVIASFDGSIRSLVNAYQTDKDSTYRKLRFTSRDSADYLCKRLVQTHGDDMIADLKARNMLRWHEEFAGEDGKKITMAHAMIGMVRTLVNFGTTILEDEQCERLALHLHKMRFPMSKPRNERLTAEQATMIRAQAHKRGKHSIALAQAFQFECMLRQKDVIGEWVPISEPGALSEVLFGNSKWHRGLRWEEIDQNLILTHVTSKRQKEIVVDLKLAPMVMEELAKLGERPAKGPIIVNEGTLRPWTQGEFGRWWRELADDCGIPRTVFNMDSRAGAISEATDAGADLEHIRHAATHSDISMTQRYSRGGEEKTAGVMRQRAEHRKNKTAT